MRASDQGILASHASSLPRPDDAWAKLHTLATGARLASERLWEVTRR